MDRKETTGISPRNQRFLRSVLAIVLENISNRELNVMWLSRWLGVSRVTLHRKLKSMCFRAQFGCKPSEFVGHGA